MLYYNGKGSLSIQLPPGEAVKANSDKNQKKIKPRILNNRFKIITDRERNCDESNRGFNKISI